MSAILQRQAAPTKKSPLLAVSPSRECAKQAFRTLLNWIGGDSDRDGLADRPEWMVRAYAEYFGGYGLDPNEILNRTFDETEGYDEMIILRNIRFVSHCEHHLSPIVGRAWVAYKPNSRVVGISKLARVVDCFARRLQIQERLTAQISNAIDNALKPKGVGVVIKAKHHCMIMRGVSKPNSDLVTTRMLGCFKEPIVRQEILSLIEGDQTR